MPGRRCERGGEEVLARARSIALGVVSRTPVRLQDREDCLQTILETMSAHHPVMFDTGAGYPGDAALLALAVRSATQFWRENRKREAKESSLDDDHRFGPTWVETIDPAPSPELAAMVSLFEAEVHSLYGRFSERPRRILALHIDGGFGPTEIAEECGLSLDAVKHTLKRSRQRLRTLLSVAGYTDEVAEFLLSVISRGNT